MTRLGAFIIGVILLELASLFLAYATGIAENCAGNSHWTCSDFLSDAALWGMVGGGVALAVLAVATAVRAGRPGRRR